MTKFYPAHFTVVCLAVFFFLDNGPANPAHPPNDTTRIADLYFQNNDTLVYAPVCAQGQTFLNPEVAHLSGASSTAPGHCASYATLRVDDTSQLWIAEVAVNEMRNRSGAEGHANHTNVIFEVYKNEENTISLQRQPTGGGLQQWKAWIDFNGNQRFEAHEVILHGEAPDLTAPFFLPENTEAGTLTRLRVLTTPRGTDLSGPSLPAGEVEDYTVMIF